MISYIDRTRLRTAVELLQVTSEIERQLEEVSLCFVLVWVFLSTRLSYQEVISFYIMNN